MEDSGLLLRSIMSECTNVRIFEVIQQVVRFIFKVALNDVT